MFRFTPEAMETLGLYLLTALPFPATGTREAQGVSHSGRYRFTLSKLRVSVEAITVTLGFPVAVYLYIHRA